MSLVLNLEGAKQQVNTQLSNKDTIDALNKLTEEFYKTSGILLYTRYRYYIKRDNKEIDPVLVQLLQNYFSEPCFDAWIRLTNLCLNNVIGFGDEFAKNFIAIYEKNLDSDSNQCAKKILKEIHRLKSNPKYDPPSYMSYRDLGDKMMILLRNHCSHEWVDNNSLQPLIELGIKDLISQAIIEMSRPLSIELLKPKLVQTDSTSKMYMKVFSIKGIDNKLISIPVDNNQDFSLNSLYLRFDPNNDPFENSSNLIYFDESDRRLYTYSKLKTNNEAVFINVPITGSIKSVTRKFKGINDVFNLSQEDLGNLKSRDLLLEKFGPIKQDNGIIHNLPLLTNTFVPRPQLENKLIKALQRRHSFIITLDGGGGFGKTALSKKVIWDIINQNLSENLKEKLKYSFIIWISAKTTFFKDGEIEEKTPSLNRLEDLLDCILYVTNNLSAISFDFDKKRDFVMQILKKVGSFLVIIDNLETVIEKKEVIEYLVNEFDEIDINSNFKIIITSRVFGTHEQHRVNVLSMEYEEARQLIIDELERWDIYQKYNSESHIKEIAEISGNIPLLIINIVSGLKNHANLAEMKKDIPKDFEKALYFICEFQWKQLSENAKNLARAIALNGGKINFGFAKTVCKFEDDRSFQQAREELQNRSFLIDSELSNNLLAMLPPIYYFVKDELAQNPTIEDKLKGELKWLNTGLEKHSKSDQHDENLKTGVLDTDVIALNEIFLRADSLTRRGAFKEAYEWYKLAVNNFPGNVDAWRELAEFEFKYIENDEKARSHFEKALELNKNDPVTYQKYAYWEFDRGAKSGEISCLKKSINLNEIAKKLFKDPASIRMTNDFIVSSLMKLAYIHKNLALNKFEERTFNFSMSEQYIKNAIDILDDNFVVDPKDLDEIRHNVIDHNSLANAYLNFGGYNDKNRKYYDFMALKNIVKGLKLQRDSGDLRFKLTNFRISKILESYKILLKRIDEKTISEIIKLEKKIEDEIDRMKVL